MRGAQNPMTEYIGVQNQEIKTPDAHQTDNLDATDLLQEVITTIATIDTIAIGAVMLVLLEIATKIPITIVAIAEDTLEVLVNRLVQVILIGAIEEI